MLIACKDIVSSDSLRQTLHGSFDMKDFHDANHILGMRMLRKSIEKITLSISTGVCSQSFVTFQYEGKQLG